MARKRVINKIVTRDEDGMAVEVPIGDVVDFIEPQADSDTGLVPEFVNISNKIQLLCIPHDEMNTITVPRYGILRGAQWRNMSQPNHRIWGDHPYFIERVTRDGLYDPKYLLSEKQTIDEINALAKRKRIREMMENAIITGEDDVGRDGIVHVSRSREDRASVLDVAMKKSMTLDEREQNRRKELGLMEEGAY